MPTILFETTGNTAPQLSITLERDGTVINLTGASVKLYINSERTGAQTNTGHETASLSGTPTDGVITYTPLAGDFPSAGRYLGDAKITYNSGTIEHVFERVTIVVRDPY